MSFFKKIADKFEDVIGDDKKKEASTHDSKGAHENYSQGYGNSAPPQPSYASGPQLPHGWISQWDPASQRYYYLEQATGRTQWEAPTFQGPPGGSSMAGPPAGYYEQHQVSTKETKDGKEKKESKSGMWKGAAGGLAVGAVGGAMVGHAMGDDSSDEEHKSHAPAYHSGYGAAPAYSHGQSGYGAAPVPAGDNHSVSSSDREDLAEAREEYENASSSDKESAREEYEEQYEETYGSD